MLELLKLIEADRKSASQCVSVCGFVLSMVYDNDVHNNNMIIIIIKYVLCACAHCWVLDDDSMNILVDLHVTIVKGKNLVR